jgi:hypothetical protein
VEFAAWLHTPARKSQWENEVKGRQITARISREVERLCYALGQFHGTGLLFPGHILALSNFDDF